MNAIVEVIGQLFLTVIMAAVSLIIMVGAVIGLLFALDYVIGVVG